MSGDSGRRSRHERALLLESVRVDADPTRVAALLDVADVDAVLDLAEIHRVGGLLHDRLTRSSIPLAAAVRERLNELRMTAATRDLMARGAVARLTSLIDVPFLVVKGPVLADDWYGRVGLRFYSDVDVLVRRSDFPGVLDNLVGGRLRELATNWRGFLDHEVAEVPLGDGRVTVDLHWHLISMGADRRDIQLPEDDLFERAREVTMGSAPVLTLDPEDTLLHVCINCGLDGARRLLQLADVDVIVRSDRIDWHVFADRARAARAHALCSAVLQRARTLLGTPIRPAALGRLEPFPGWLVANAVIDRRQRDAPRLRDGIASGLLLSCGRATPRRTLATATRAADAALRVRLGAPAPTAPDGALFWKRSAGSAHDEADRRRYLQWVAAHRANARH